MQTSINKFFDEGLLWLAEKNSRAGEAFPSGSALSGSAFSGSALSGSALSGSALSVSAAASFGIPAIDRELQNGGVEFSRLHEWFSFSPTILSVLIGNGIRDIFKKEESFARFILWIGKEAWPTPYILEQTLRLDCKSLLDYCLFIDVSDSKNKYWCFEAALRSPAVAAAICSLKGLNLAATRRLALAAKKGASLGFLIRPPREAAFLSAAATRWNLGHVPSPSFFPRWELSLLKQKGKQPGTASWIIELQEDEKISLHIPSDVVDQPRSTEIDKKRLLA